MQRNPRPRETPPRPRRLLRWSITLTALTVFTAGLTGIADAAPASHQPVGHLNAIRQVGDHVLVKGWAYDADTTASARVTVSVNGKWRTTLSANGSRPDIDAKHPGYGTKRGFKSYLAVPAGKLTICAGIVNYPARKLVRRLACQEVTTSYNPTGKITSIVQTPGKVTVSGWTLDLSHPTMSLSTNVRLDGRKLAAMTANLRRSDLAKAYPSAGTAHGFSYLLAVTEGVHTFCVKAANVGVGANTVFGCLTKTINFSPTGKITKLIQTPGGVSVTGYASDPDTTSPIKVTITANGKTLGTVSSKDAGATKPGYGFHARYLLPGTKLAPGNRTICAVGRNFGTDGKDRAVQCIRRYLNWNPTASVDKLSQKSPGATITGWATDPDTSAPIKVYILADGKKVTKVIANGTGTSHSGHRFTATVTLPDGKHSVCASAVNTRYGSGNSPAKCMTIALAFEPYGAFESVTRAKGSTNVVATGWAIDPDSTSAIPVQVSIDGGDPVTQTANISRPELAKKHPGAGTLHGYAVSVAASDGEHKVCVQAVNVQGGSGTTSLGCKIINAVHPTAPAAPRKVSAIAGYGGARIVWAPPTSDGGAPWSRYTVTALPGGNKMTVAAGINTATLLGLKPSTKYTFSVVANNVAGASVGGTSPAVTTEKEPPAQTSPAPISTSRYIRNIHGASSTDLAAMRREGAADAKANPSGHGYLVVLAVGGQDESRKGVVLSATIRFVSYPNIVKNLNAYVDGYASQQRPSAPVTIAIATNNDIDVWRGSGVNFANEVVDPVRSHTARYPGITIAGSNDMEPGFRATYTSSKAWLQGYLSATPAPFVFTGSADGCAWTATNRGCNNGWTMSGMFYLAGGASAIRIVNLPQIYNSTMARQWRYISLTGVQGGYPKINFGGALTEYTACQQERSCGSLTAVSAWKDMWSQLRAEPKLKPSSLPYSTDLRIDS